MDHPIFEQSEIFDIFSARGNMKAKFRNAVRGKFLAEELHKLGPSASFVEIFDAKEKADLKAAMTAEIMASEIDAIQLKAMLDDIIATTQKFTKKHKK